MSFISWFIMADSFKKDNTKIKSFNWYWHVINGKKKGITGGIYHSIYWHTKANNRYMKYYGKNKESSYIQYVYVNNLYSWAISQKLPVNISERIKDTSQFNEDFIKNYNEESDEGYFLKVDVY